MTAPLESNRVNGRTIRWISTKTGFQYNLSTAILDTIRSGGRNEHKCDTERGRRRSATAPGSPTKADGEDEAKPKDDNRP